MLCSALRSPHCNLETLRCDTEPDLELLSVAPWCSLPCSSFSLSGCQLTEEGCAALALALNSNPSHLRELDLSYNHPGDSGQQLLSAGLQGGTWSLDTLR